MALRASKFDFGRSLFSAADMAHTSYLFRNPRTLITGDGQGGFNPLAPAIGKLAGVAANAAREVARAMHAWDTATQADDVEAVFDAARKLVSAESLRKREGGASAARRTLVPEEFVAKQAQEISEAPQSDQISIMRGIIGSFGDDAKDGVAKQFAVHIPVKIVAAALNDEQEEGGAEHGGLEAMARSMSSLNMSAVNRILQMEDGPQPARSLSEKGGYNQLVSTRLAEGPQTTCQSMQNLLNEAREATGEARVRMLNYGSTLDRYQKDLDQSIRDADAIVDKMDAVERDWSGREMPPFPIDGFELRRLGESWLRFLVRKYGIFIALEMIRKKAPELGAYFDKIGLNRNMKATLDKQERILMNMKEPREDFRIAIADHERHMNSVERLKQRMAGAKCQISRDPEWWSRYG